MGEAARDRWLARARAGWPAARAALIALAMALGLLHGCPIPGREQTPAWARGAVADADAARRALLEPFAWIARDLDLLQRWALFSGASPKRYRLYLEGQTAAGAWELVHRAADPEHAAYAALLAYRRTRGSYNPSGKQARAPYYAFARWLVLRMLDDHPRYVAGRMRMERIVIEPPGFRPTGELTFEHHERSRR